MARFVDTPRFSISLLACDILKIHIKQNVSLEASDMRTLAGFYDKLTKGEKLPFLVLLDKYVMMTEEAREIVSSKERLKYKLMEAVVTTSLPQKILINNIIQKQRNTHQIEMFNSEADGIDWLIKQMQLHKELSDAESLINS